jgi:hypothetical protein
MPKKTRDYDNVFKTLKSKHKRLFISVINDAFGKNYPLDTKVEALPTEGYLTENETTDGSKEIEGRDSDFLIRIGGENYLLTSITFTFPSGQKVQYESDNIFLDKFTKEYIIEKRLFPYIPFYIARYERALVIEESKESVHAHHKRKQKSGKAGERHGRNYN